MATLLEDVPAAQARGRRGPPVAEAVAAASVLLVVTTVVGATSVGGGRVTGTGERAERAPSSVGAGTWEGFRLPLPPGTTVLEEGTGVRLALLDGPAEASLVSPQQVVLAGSDGSGRAPAPRDLAAWLVEQDGVAVEVVLEREVDGRRAVDVLWWADPVERGLGVGAPMPLLCSWGRADNGGCLVHRAGDRVRTTVVEGEDRPFVLEVVVPGGSTTTTATTGGAQATAPDLAAVDRAHEDLLDTLDLDPPGRVDAG